GQSLVQRYLWAPAEEACGQTGMQAAPALLPGPGGAVARRALDSCDPGQPFVQVVHRCLHPGADVDGPGDVGLFEGAHVGGGHVPQVHEVARLRSVSIPDRRLAAAQSMAEDRDHARLAHGVLAGPVDVRVAQGDAADAVDVPPGAEVELEG